MYVCKLCLLYIKNNNSALNIWLKTTTLKTTLLFCRSALECFTTKIYCILYTWYFWICIIICDWFGHNFWFLCINIKINYEELTNNYAAGVLLELSVIFNASWSVFGNHKSNNNSFLKCTDTKKVVGRSRPSLKIEFKINKGYNIFHQTSDNHSVHSERLWNSRKQRLVSMILPIRVYF